MELWKEGCVSLKPFMLNWRQRQRGWESGIWVTQSVKHLIAGNLLGILSCSLSLSAPPLSFSLFLSLLLSKINKLKIKPGRRIILQRVKYRPPLESLT